MKIGIDARFYGPFGKGLGRYTQELIKGLEKVDTKNEYIIFVRSENFDDYIPQNKNFTKVIADFSWYTLEEQIKMPKLLYSHNLDLVHFPHFNVPLGYRKPFVVTIHDLIIMHFPTKRATTLGPLKYALKQFGYRKVITSAVRKARHIITVSRFSKNDILSYFKVPSSDITVTYQSIFTGAKDVVSIQKYSDKPYFLYVGNVYPHKNIEFLVKAFSAFKQEAGREDYQLILVGKNDYFFEKVKSFVKENKVKDVIFTGFVTDTELSSLYQDALCYVFPSLYEGVGLPPLEAMAHSTPVISSDATCMPEILSDAAIYFNPRDVNSLKEGLRHIADNPDVRKELEVRGVQQVAKYSSEQCARDTLAVYEKAVK